MYVGGSGPGNYSKIQDALNDTDGGYTVFVYSGIYLENIVIYNSINLVGEDRDSTIIDGGGSGKVIFIFAEKVKIYDFEIRNGDVGILTESGRGIIANCTIHGNSNSGYGHGISLSYCSKNKIINCTIYNNEFAAIYLWSSTYNQILNCNVYQNSYGIHLLSSSRNRIFNCNAYSGGIGIYLEGSSCRYNDVVNCITFDNKFYGILITFGASSNKIINCCTYDNPDGIKIKYESPGNRVSHCDILNNSRGVHIDNSKNNHFYHNNFINNTLNAKANKYNNWDYGYPSGGNYWDDYTGTDDDGDGIGDTPYPIPGDSNEDRYPLMEPWDENIPPIVYFTFSPGIPKPGQTVSFDASSSYDVDGFIVLYEWDWDDDGEFDESHTIPTATHSWPISGSHPVVVRVSDDGGQFNTENRLVTVTAPPEKPIITGPKKGAPDVKYNFTFLSFDPEGSNITYCVVWWEGPHGWDEDYFGPYPSGTMITVKYAYKWTGTFEVRAQAIDELGQKSEWGYWKIRIPRNRASSSSYLLRFLEQFPMLREVLLRLINL